MQTDKGISVNPVSAGGVAAIDDRDGRVGVGEQRVGERHPRGAGTDNEIVRFEAANVPHRGTVARVRVGRTTICQVSRASGLRRRRGAAGVLV